MKNTADAAIIQSNYKEIMKKEKETVLKSEHWPREEHPAMGSPGKIKKKSESTAYRY